MKNIGTIIYSLTFLGIIGMCIWMTQNPWWALLIILAPSPMCNCEEEEEEQ